MSDQHLELAKALLIGLVEEDRKGRLHTKYLKGSKEKQARQAIARLLRSDCALDVQLRWHLANLFDPSFLEQRTIRFVHMEGGKPIDHIANIHLFSLVWDEVREGKSVTQAVQAVAEKFSLSDEMVTRIWSKYRRIYLPNRP